MTLRLRPAVRTTVVLAAAALLTTACSGHIAARSDPSASSASSPSAAPETPATTSKSRSTSTPAASTTAVSDRTDPSSPAADGDDPKARAGEAFHHWTSQVPVYPGATPWEAGAGSAALGTPQVEGLFTITTTWTTADAVPTVIKWFHSRVQIMGFQGAEYGPVARWNISFDPTTTDRAAVTAASLSLLIGTGGRGTLIRVVAAGAPIPERSADSLIPKDRIIGASIRITPGGTVPAGQQPRHARTVIVGKSDRDQLVALLNSMSVQPPAQFGGLAFGYTFVLTLRADDGPVAVVHYDSSHPGLGPLLEYGDRQRVQLGVSGTFHQLLDRLCGVTRS